MSNFDDELKKAAMGDLDDLGNVSSQSSINPPQKPTKKTVNAPYASQNPVLAKSTGFNKKFVAIVTVIALVILGAVITLVAVNSDKTTEGYDDANYSDADTENNEQSSENDDFINGLKIEIDGTEYSFPMSVSDFHNLGWEPSDEKEHPHDDWVLSAYDLEDDYKSYKQVYKNSALGVIDVEVYVFNYSSEEKNYNDCAVAGIDISERDFPTGNTSFYGLTLGRSSYDDVINTFGNIVQDDDSDDCYYYYFLEHDNKNHMIEFRFDDSNILDSLLLVNVNAQLFDDSDVQLRTVDNRFNVVPSSLSDNIFDYQFIVNGDLYQMPITPQALLDNNYDIPDAETIIGSQKSYELKVNYNGASTSIYIQNYSDGPAKAKDCPIYSIELGYGDNVFRDFELSHGITIGTDPEDIADYLVSMGMNDDDIDLYKVTNDEYENIRSYHFYPASDNTVSGVKIYFDGYLSDLYYN